MIRQLNVWQLQDDQPILKIAARAAHKVLADYYKKSMETRHSFVATICDPRYKLKALAFFSQATGSLKSLLAIKGKAHFKHVYGQYNQRAVRIKEYQRQKAVNDMLDVVEDTEEEVEED